MSPHHLAPYINPFSQSHWYGRTDHQLSPPQKRLRRKIKPRFERALEDEMTKSDGRILSIRSELTGLNIPGLSGTLSDCINAMNLTAYVPHIGSRVWAIIRNEHIHYTKDGKLTIEDLRAFVAGCAAEFDDEKIR